LHALLTGDTFCSITYFNCCLCLTVHLQYDRCKFQVEILAQQSSYEALKVQGASLISGSSGDPQEEQAKQLLDKLDKGWNAVLDAWQQRMNLLEQCKNYLVSKHSALSLYIYATISIVSLNFILYFIGILTRSQGT